MYLNKDSLEVEIVSSKSSEMNVMLPSGDDFVSFKNIKLKTNFKFFLIFRWNHRSPSNSKLASPAIPFKQLALKAWDKHSKFINQKHFVHRFYNKKIIKKNKYFINSLLQSRFLRLQASTSLLKIIIQFRKSKQKRCTFKL